MNCLRYRASKLSVGCLCSRQVLASVRRNHESGPMRMPVSSLRDVYARRKRGGASDRCRVLL